MQSEEQDKEQLQLHWNEARRIYSEPMQTIQHLSTSEEATVTEASAPDARSQCCAVASEQLARKSTSSEQGTLDGTQISDEDDYDDVFLQSWEEEGQLAS